MKYKAYITGHIPEEERIKIFVRVYDSDEPTQKKVTNDDGVEETIVRDEYPITIYVPYGQNEGYIKDKVKEALEKFKQRQVSIDKIESLKLSNTQVE